jgi:hypothetical protein
MDDAIQKLREDHFPDWYIQKRLKSQKLLETAPPARYGMDIDPGRYGRTAPGHIKVSSFSELPEPIKERAATVGTRPDEEYRSGSHLQQDEDTTYLGYTQWEKEKLLPISPDGVVILKTEDAIRRYPWLQSFWFKTIPLNLDKYTTFVGANECGGVFIWVKRGTNVELPIQACFYVGASDYVQVPHTFIIAEPYSKVHLISGCVVGPTCERSAHIASTEIYVGEGAEVSFSMLHNWRQDFEVRPRVGAIVDKEGTYRENYILLSEVRNIQIFPTVILRGEGAKASLRMLILGRGKSDIDVGGGIVFNAPHTRGEMVSRAVIADCAKVRMRGLLHAYQPYARGHLDCRGLLLSDKAQVLAFPALRARPKSSELSHEAAIGMIAPEQLNYLMSRGFSKGEATSMIARGFLDTDIPGLPPELQSQIGSLVSATAREVM